MVGQVFGILQEERDVLKEQEVRSLPPGFISVSPLILQHGVDVLSCVSGAYLLRSRYATQPMLAELAAPGTHDGPTKSKQEGKNFNKGRGGEPRQGLSYRTKRTLIQQETCTCPSMSSRNARQQNLSLFVNLSLDIHREREERRAKDLYVVLLRSAAGAFAYTHLRSVCIFLCIHTYRERGGGR